MKETDTTDYYEAVLETIKIDNAERLQEYIDNGLDINKDYVIIDLAIKYNSIKIVKLLLQKDKSLFIKRVNKKKLLLKVVENHNEELLKILLEAETDSEVKFALTREILLYKAVQIANNEKTVELLLKAEATIKVAYRMSASNLSVAARIAYEKSKDNKDFTKTLELLLSKTNPGDFIKELRCDENMVVIDRERNDLIIELLIKNGTSIYKPWITDFKAIVDCESKLSDRMKKVIMQTELNRIEQSIPGFAAPHMIAKFMFNLKLQTNHTITKSLPELIAYKLYMGYKLRMQSIEKIHGAKLHELMNFSIWACRNTSHDDLVIKALKIMNKCGQSMGKHISDLYYSYAFEIFVVACQEGKSEVIEYFMNNNILKQNEDTISFLEHHFKLAIEKKYDEIAALLEKQLNLLKQQLEKEQQTALTPTELIAEVSFDESTEDATKPLAGDSAEE